MDQTQEQQQMQMLMTQLQDANLRQSVMQYINQTANALDKDANSKALIETLARESVHNQKSSAVWKSRTKKSVAAGVVAVVLAITVQFLVNYFSNELSKESHVDKQGAMVSTDGRVVKTQMEEMKVGADGALLSRNGDATVKTMPSLAKVALDSSLPDATLMALEEISVHSEKGYTLQIKVHGFSRVPVLNSRCGNVVHFYTAWKGKVTLDSTDLLLDEATAAEFRGAGFSMATGGRRLADEVSLDAFVRAVDDMKRSGKWTCANVALPIVSAHASSEKTTYSLCGARKDKKNACYSKYGGLMLGVTALEGVGFPAASQTDQLYQSRSVSTMKSVRYSVALHEYPMHPGQQLVTITDVASGKKSTFQIKSDHKRSHCDTKVQHKKPMPPKIDSDWHIEYMGITEVDGKILRGFNMHVNSELLVHWYGDGSRPGQSVQFWDIAENLQPYAISPKPDVVTMFRSYKSVMTDAEIETALKKLSGKNVAELLSCTNDEKLDLGVPTMGLSDLTLDHVAYYAHSSAEHSEAFSKYVEDATNNDAMSDFCYESCKVAVDTFRSLTGDVCQDGIAAAAVDCLQQIRVCQSSNFVFQHRNECVARAAKTTNATRTLGETEELWAETAEPVQLLVNETRFAHRELNSRRLGGPDLGASAGDFPSLPCWLSNTIGMCDGQDPACWCVKFAFAIRDDLDFFFQLKVGTVEGAWGLYIAAGACAPIAVFLGLPPDGPLYGTACMGGSIEIVDQVECPSFPWKITATLWKSADCGVSIPYVVGFSFLLVEVGFTAGTEYKDGNIATCRWVLSSDFPFWGWMSEETRDAMDTWWRRRRVFRRRYDLSCRIDMECDLYVGGYGRVEILESVEVKIDWKYYFITKKLTVWLDIKYFDYTWDWDWVELTHYLMWEEDFTGLYAPSRGEGVEVGCWGMHWGWTTANDWDAKVKGTHIGHDYSMDGRHIWWSASLNTATQRAQEACDTHNAAQNGNLDNICKAVVCWSTQTELQEPTASAWECQMRSTRNVFEAASYDWRVRTYLPEPCPEPPRYTGPDFLGAVVWGMNWGRDVSQKVWGPAGRRIWKKSTIQEATRLAMEGCKYHNSVVTGSANGAVCKAVVCWSTQTEAQEPVASQWACQLRGNRNHVAAASVAYRVRTYIPEACQKCANHRWKQHWGEENFAKVDGSADSETIFKGWGSNGLNWATKQGKEACGHHNSVTTGNLCKSVVCWTKHTVQEVKNPAHTNWECQMRSNNVLAAADTDYRVRTYTPEACS